MVNISVATVAVSWARLLVFPFLYSFCLHRDVAVRHVVVALDVVVQLVVAQVRIAYHSGKARRERHEMVIILEISHWKKTVGTAKRGQ